MKKFTLILAAIFAVAFTAPVFAADNLELSGDFYLRGWNIENKDYTDTKEYDFDADGTTDYTTDNDQSNFDQRIRLQGKINATDNAYVVIRADMGETSWGLGFDGANGVQRPRDAVAEDGRTTGTNIDFDRLYGHFENENLVLSVGQQYLGLGINEVVDSNMPAAVATLKLGPVFPTFVYAKGSENGSFVDEGIFSDIDLYATNIGLYLGQNLRANVFGVYGDMGYVGNMPGMNLLENGFSTTYEDTGNQHTVFNEWQDGEAWVLGFHATGSFGMVNLTSELSFLNATYNAVIDTYENDTSAAAVPGKGEVEATGTQFYVKADSDVTDMFNVGAEGFWAQGADAGELQLTNLSDFSSFTIADANSPAAMDLAFADLINGNPATPNPISPFDFTGDHAGVVGCSLFGRYQLADNIAMGAKVAYLTPEDEDKTDIDNLTSLTVWADYMLGSNTSFTLLYNIASPEEDADTEYEDMNTLYGRFMITF